jgi:hypothetical protein
MSLLTNHNRTRHALRTGQYVADLDELESGDATLSASMQPQYAGELSTAQIISEMTESVALQGDESEKGICIIWLPRVCFLQLDVQMNTKVFFPQKRCGSSCGPFARG